MPQVIVGDAPVKVGWAEYFFSILPRNTPIEWRGAKNMNGFGNSVPENGRGVFLYAWWCQDVVAAEVDCDGRRVGIMPEFYPAMRVRRLKAVEAR